MDKYIGRDISYEDYEALLKREVVRPRFRLLKLNPDESIGSDLHSEIILREGSYNEEYQNGSRRSLSISALDFGGKYSYEGLTSLFGWGKRFRFEVGTEYRGNVFWQPKGVFTSSGVEGEGSDKLSVSLIDKYALLDGTVSGALETDYKIQRGSNVFDIFQSTLLSDCGTGYAFDMQSIYMDEDLKELCTYYTMTQSAESSYGDFFDELREQLNAELYYDDNGHINVRNALDDLALVKTPSMWEYSRGDKNFLEIIESVKYSDKYNAVRIVGAQVDGDLYTCEVENTNPLSKLRVGLNPKKVKFITDSNIVSQQYVNDRALLELWNITLNEIDYSLKSSFLPHISVGKCVTVTDANHRLYGERLFVKGVSFNIGGAEMTLTAVNIKDMPYFENYGYDLVN